MEFYFLITFFSNIKTNKRKWICDNDIHSTQHTHGQNKYFVSKISFIMKLNRFSTKKIQFYVCVWFFFIYREKKQFVLSCDSINGWIYYKRTRVSDERVSVRDKWNKITTLSWKKKEKKHNLKLKVYSWCISAWFGPANT